MSEKYCNRKKEECYELKHNICNKFVPIKCYPGPIGPPGATGASGSTGAIGPSGASGASGPNNLLLPTGESCIGIIQGILQVVTTVDLDLNYTTVVTPLEGTGYTATGATNPNEPIFTITYDSPALIYPSITAIGDPNFNNIFPTQQSGNSVTLTALNFQVDTSTVNFQAIGPCPV